MKRLLYIWYILCLLALPLLLSGCAGIYANTREVEELLVIQTMGLDDDPAGVRLTLASGAGVHAEGAPLRLEGRGPSITTAIERVRSLANEEDLFCAHIGHVLIGEEAAKKGLDPALAYICRSPDLRLSVPLYVLRGGEAAQAVLEVGNDRYGICDALDSVNGDVKLRGDGHVTTAAEVARDLARQGSALICAVDCLPSAEKDSPKSGGEGEPAKEALAQSGGAGDAPLMTVSAAGFGVLKDGRLCAYIDRDKAVAVGLLTGETGPCELTVTGRDGTRTTLSLERGRMELRPVWAGDGGLTRLELSVEAQAAVAETETADVPAQEALRALLEAALSERIGAVLQLSKQLRADFLGFGSRIERLSPGRYHALGRPFAEVLAETPVRLTVSVRLTHTGDTEESAA